MKKRFSFLLIALLLIGGAVIADRFETELRNIETEGANSLKVNFDFGAGTIRVLPADIKDAAELEINYTPEWVDFDINYDKRGETGYLTLESDIRKHRNFDDIENEWDVKLSNNYPMELNLDIGACEAEIDLGGIPLEELVIEVGAASGTVEFTKPNPKRMKEMDIDVGASSFEMINLANANFSQMNFSCGAASCELDFRGDLQISADIFLDVGVGSVDVIVDKDTGIRVKSDDSWFSSVDYHGLRMEEVRDGVFESRNYKDAKNQLNFNVDVGMGSVDFRGR